MARRSELRQCCTSMTTRGSQTLTWDLENRPVKGEGDKLVAQRTGTTPNYIHLDHLGGTSEIRDTILISLTVEPGCGKLATMAGISRVVAAGYLQTK